MRYCADRRTARAEVGGDIAANSADHRYGESETHRAVACSSLEVRVVSLRNSQRQRAVACFCVESTALQSAARKRDGERTVARPGPHPAGQPVQRERSVARLELHVTGNVFDVHWTIGRADPKIRTPGGPNDQVSRPPRIVEIAWPFGSDGRAADYRPHLARD